MKKNLIALIAAVSMIASSAAVFADEIPAQEVVSTPEEDIVPISDDVLIHEPVNVIASSYISSTVTVTEVTDGKISTTLNVDDAENPENTINYTITEDTLVLGYSNGDVKSVNDIKNGDVITVYTNAYSPAPLILPPQYQADVIFVEDNEEISPLRMVDVDTYILQDEMLVNVDNTLALNIDETTVIVDKNGNEVSASELANKDLVVIYSTSTRSIPAQTNPIKVVVLGENEVAVGQLEVINNEITPEPEVTEEPEDEKIDYKTVKSININGLEITNFYEKNNTLMVPLRVISEYLGFTVEWDGETKSIMLNSGIYSLKIGENAYIKGKMMPITLVSEPELKEDDLTYVPVEYFTEILEAAESITFNIR